MHAPFLILLSLHFRHFASPPRADNLLLTSFIKGYILAAKMPFLTSPFLRRLSKAFFKYLLAGGMGFLIDYTTLTICLSLLGLHYLISASAGFICGLVFVYISSNKWVFETRQMKENRLLEFSIFLIIGLIGLLLTNLLMWALVDGLNIHALIAKLFTTGVVLMWNFGARKFILY